METVLLVKELLLLFDLLLDNVIVVHASLLWRRKFTSLFRIMMLLLIDCGSSQLLSFSKPLLHLLDHALEAF